MRVPEQRPNPYKDSGMINKTFHNNHMTINIIAIPMQGSYHNGTGMERMPRPSDRLNSKTDFFHPNGRLEGNKSMDQQQITIKFNAGHHMK